MSAKDSFVEHPEHPLARARMAVARALASAGVGPDQLTVAGLLASVAAGFLFWKGWFAWGGLALVAGAMGDLFDGAVARVTGRSSRWGAFLDSTLDRMSDAAVFVGIILYYMRHASDKYVVLALASLVAALLTSYTRARAETLIERCDVGLFERPERIGVLIFSGLTGLMGAGLWVLAVAGGVTVVQRMAHVWLALKCQDIPAANLGKTSDEPDSRNAS